MLSHDVPTQPEYPIIEERFRLRPVQEGDVAAINAYRSIPEVVRYLPHPAQSLADTQNTVDRMVTEAGLPRPGTWLDLAVVHPGTGALLGEVLLKWDAEEPDSGEIGFVFHPSVHGTGLPTLAVNRVLRIGFEDLGWRRIIGIADARNTRSGALMRRLGMRQEAQHLEAVECKGEYCTMDEFAMLSREWLARSAQEGPRD